MKLTALFAAVFTIVPMVSMADDTKISLNLTGVIAKVDGTNVTVTTRHDRGNKDVVVATDDKTVVKIDGKDAKVADLKEGMYATVTPPSGTAKTIVATTRTVIVRPEQPRRPEQRPTSPPQ